jgi:uncharacterized protein YkwD
MALRRHAVWNVIGALAAPLIIAIALVSSVATTAPSKAEALDNEEASFLAILNDYRAQNGLGPLVLDERLNTVARWMANDLAAHNYFSHTDSLGRDPFDRMDQLGYTVNTWRGENLVAGTEGAAYAFQMWQGSDGHRANMLGANYTSVGIARAYSVSSDFGWYWATEFGGDAVGAPPPQQPAPAPPPAPEPEPQPPAPVVQPEPQPVEPQPQQEAAPPPEAPTIAPTPVPTPVDGAQARAVWFDAIELVFGNGSPDAFQGTVMASVRDVFGGAGSDRAVRALR